MVDVPYQCQLRFEVSGTPVAKQSFRFRSGGGYQPPRVVAWEKEIARCARAAMGDRLPFIGQCEVRLDFRLPTKRRVDLGNLSKPVLDACNKIAFKDDSQVVQETNTKRLDRDNPGVSVVIVELP